MKRLVTVFCVAVWLLEMNSCCNDENRNFYVTLYGMVNDYETDELIPNATVILSLGGKTKTTGTDGRYEFTDLDAAQYTIIVQKEGYQTNRKTVTALEGDHTEVNIPLTKK